MDGESKIVELGGIFLDSMVEIRISPKVTLYDRKRWLACLPLIRANIKRNAAESEAGEVDEVGRSG